MKKQQKIWVFKRPKSAKPEMPEAIKIGIETKAAKLIDKVLKPAYIKPPRKNQNANYINNIYTKWHRGYFYFCATYACPGPRALSPTFETGFARIEYIGNRCFNLSYMRSTGIWLEIHNNLTLDRCLSVVKKGGPFIP